MQVRSYLLKLALFILPLLMFFACLEYELRQIPNDFNYKSSYLEKHADSLEILILGSSHSLSFIRPELMHSNAFNAASLHQTLKFDRLIYEKFKGRMSKLKTVIIPISYGSYFTSLSHGKDKWRLKDYKLYYDYNEVGPYYSLNVLNGSTPHQIREVFTYKTKNENLITCSEKGFGLQFSRNAQANLEKTGIKVAKAHTRECSDEFINENVTALEAIIKSCSDKNINVVLYTAPAWHTYRENIDAATMQKTYDITQKLIKKYSNIKYINYFDDSRFISSDFRDVDHLNENGASKFTKILMSDTDIN